MTDGYKTSSAVGGLRIILQELAHANGEAFYNVKRCRGRTCDETNAHKYHTYRVEAKQLHLKGKFNIFSEDLKLNNKCKSKCGIHSNLY